MNYLIDRLREPSTWRGIFAVLTGIGVGLEPEQIELIIPAGVGLIGLIGMLFPDAPVKPPNVGKPPESDPVIVTGDDRK